MSGYGIFKMEDGMLCFLRKRLILSHIGACQGSNDLVRAIYSCMNFNG